MNLLVIMYIHVSMDEEDLYFFSAVHYVHYAVCSYLKMLLV